jgi:predicted PurR-regulated permease PerM
MSPDTDSAKTRDSAGADSPLRWIIVSLTAAAAYVCWPLWPSLVLAAWTAELARPLLVRFERRLKGRRRAAAVLTLLLFLVLALPLVGVFLGVLSGAQELAQLVRQQSTAKGALESIATGAATVPQLPTDLATAFDLVRRYGEQGASVLQNVAGVAASGLISLFIYFAGAHAFLLHGPRAWGWVKSHSPLEPAHLERFGSAFRETGHGLLVGVGLTSATQGFVATLAYLAL